MKNWIIESAQPLIAPGQLHPEYDAGGAGAAHVIRVHDTYRMVYWGRGHGGYHILQAEAPVSDPNNWKPLGGPLLGPQPETPHNSQGPAFPFLLPLSPSHWLLYFTGWGHRADGHLPNTTGVAISDDGGMTYHYHDQHPVIPLDRPWDAEGTGSIWILKESDRLRMYYTALGAYQPKPEGIRTHHGDPLPQIGIGYAESTDGLHWQKPLDHLVVSPRGFDIEPYEYICSKPCILKQGNRYIMWVSTFGTAYRVHRLTSHDGIHWQWEPRIEPDGELGIGTTGAFDDHQRSYPTMIATDDGTLHCWYTGNAFGCHGMGYAVAASGKGDR